MLSHVSELCVQYGVCLRGTQSFEDQLERAQHTASQIADRNTMAAGMARGVTVALSRVQLLLEP